MDWSWVFDVLVAVVPAPYAHFIVLLASGLVTASTVCRIVLAKLPPPKVGSWLTIPYRVAQFLAVSKGFQTSAYQPGAKAVMIPDDESRTQAALAIGLDPASTHPKNAEPPRLLAPPVGPGSVVTPVNSQT